MLGILPQLTYIWKRARDANRWALFYLSCLFYLTVSFCSTPASDSSVSLPLFHVFTELFHDNHTEGIVLQRFLERFSHLLVRVFILDDPNRVDTQDR